MTSSVRPPVLAEIASVAREPFAAFGPAADRRYAPILRNETARAYAPYGHDIYSVYQELEDKDGHLFAALQTRKLGVLARDRRLAPVAAGDSPDALRAHAVCERALAGIADLPQVLAAILDALAKGFAVLEVLWAVADDGAILPRRVVPRWPGRFTLDADGALRRLDRGDPPEGRAMPPRKFLVACFQPQPGQPCGTGLCLRAYWYSWFKRNNLKAWGLFNEKFGAPTVVATFPAGTDAAERARLLEVVESVQQDAGIILPEGVALDLLEAKRSGQVATYRELADWCNDEISKIVLGQTLTSGEGRRSGSRALGEVHDTIRNEYIEADAALLESVVNDQILRWVVDFNVGPDVAAPRLRVDTAREERLLDDAALDKLLLGMGVPMGVDYFYDRYRRPRPTEGAPVVHYDDANVFQYHLRFGILSINEVRERLGYPPVAWGDRQVNAQELAGLADPPARTASRREDASREDPPERELDEVEHGALGR